MGFTEFSGITEVISQTSRGKKEVGHVQWKSNEADIFLFSYIRFLKLMIQHLGRFDGQKECN